MGKNWYCPVPAPIHMTNNDPTKFACTPHFVLTGHMQEAEEA